jgi:hypothetical protein
MAVKIFGEKVKTGMTVQCTFTCGTTVMGKLYIDQDDQMWICHNEPNKDGSQAPSRLGFRFSWTFRYDPDTNRFTDDIRTIAPVVDGLTFKKDVCVDDTLSQFIEMQGNQSDLWMCMNAAIKPFEDYNSYKLSETAGFIRISGKVQTEKGLFDKSCEVKLARFISKSAESLVKKGVKVGIDDKALERISNNLVAFKSGDYLKMEYLEGEDIIKGYMKTNYSNSATGTIHKSCMTDKLDNLELYTKNRKVKLAVLRSDNGIEARCLVWSSGGKKYYDRIYHTLEWVVPILEKKLVADGVKKLTSCRTVKSVKLENHDLDHYPYLDSFKFLDPKEGVLYFARESSMIPSGQYWVLTHTDGTYSEHTIHHE